jgi:hypothetical protein
MSRYRIYTNKQAGNKLYKTFQKAADAIDKEALNNGADIRICDESGMGYYRWFKVKAFHQLAGIETESLTDDENAKDWK